MLKEKTWSREEETWMDAGGDVGGGRRREGGKRRSGDEKRRGDERKRACRRN